MQSAQIYCHSDTGDQFSFPNGLLLSYFSVKICGYFSFPITPCMFPQFIGLYLINRKVIKEQYTLRYDTVLHQLLQFSLTSCPLN